MARPFLLTFSNFQLPQPIMKNKNLILPPSTSSLPILLYGSFSSSISRRCIYGGELRLRQKVITTTTLNLFCCRWTKMSENIMITLRWVYLLHLQAINKETVVETVWDTFLKSYCAGVAALICKSRRQQGTENQLLFALTQASSGGVHAHGRLRYAHQIRSDEVAETGLMDLCARYHSPLTDC